LEAQLSPKDFKVWIKEISILGEWLKSAWYGKATGTVSRNWNSGTSASTCNSAETSAVVVPPSETQFDVNIIVHTYLPVKY
jgi:hypothetical protein